MGTPNSVIFGCEGLELTSWEKSFFQGSDPLGFILFARNCETPDQLRGLVADLRDSVGRADAPVLIDQEGGRVARLKPPHWRKAPPARCLGILAETDLAAGIRAAEINARLLAWELMVLGINVDCIPLLDCPCAGAHDVIGDRAFGTDTETIAALGQAVCDGLLAGGVLPVAKHLPGHGRAEVDSHHELPRVSASLEALRETDFTPFKALKDAPWGMTAHVVFEAIDPDNPATTSKKVIEEVIRREMGFDGLLLSDDLSMSALDGSLGERASASLAAGCDVALHCNGKAEEMEAVATAAGRLSEAAQRRIEAGSRRVKTPGDIDPKALEAEFASLLAGIWP